MPVIIIAKIYCPKCDALVKHVGVPDGEMFCLNCRAAEEDWKAGYQIIKKEEQGHD